MCFRVASSRRVCVSKPGGGVKDGFVLARSGMLFQFPPIVLPPLRMLKLGSHMKTHLKTKVGITIQFIPLLRIKESEQKDRKRQTMCVCVLFKLLH